MQRKDRRSLGSIKLQGFSIKPREWVCELHLAFMGWPWKHWTLLKHLLFKRESSNIKLLTHNFNVCPFLYLSSSVVGNTCIESSVFSPESSQFQDRGTAICFVLLRQILFTIKSPCHVSRRDTFKHTCYLSFLAKTLVLHRRVERSDIWSCYGENNDTLLTARKKLLKSIGDMNFHLKGSWYLLLETQVFQNEKLTLLIWWPCTLTGCMIMRMTNDAHFKFQNLNNLPLKSKIHLSHGQCIILPLIGWSRLEG